MRATLLDATGPTGPIHPKPVSKLHSIRERDPDCAPRFATRLQVLAVERDCVAAQDAVAAVQTSAMVAAEWTMRSSFYQGWALPFEAAAQLYQSLERGEEARDTARLALRQPWWTVSDLGRCAARPRMVLLGTRWPRSSLACRPSAGRSSICCAVLQIASRSR